MIVGSLPSTRECLSHPHDRTPCRPSGVNPGRIAVPRQSDVGAKVCVQSLIWKVLHQRSRVSVAIDRETARIPCRGVGHTGRRREMPRELHLRGAKLPYFPMGLWLPCFAGAQRRGPGLILTHKGFDVRKCIWTSGHEQRCSLRDVRSVPVVKLCWRATRFVYISYPNKHVANMCLASTEASWWQRLHQAGLHDYNMEAREVLRVAENRSTTNCSFDPLTARNNHQDIDQRMHTNHVITLFFVSQARLYLLLAVIYADQQPQPITNTTSRTPIIYNE